MISLLVSLWDCCCCCSLLFVYIIVPYFIYIVNLCEYKCKSFKRLRSCDEYYFCQMQMLWKLLNHLVIALWKVPMIISIYHMNMIIGLGQCLTPTAKPSCPKPIIISIDWYIVFMLKSIYISTKLPSRYIHGFHRDDSLERGTIICARLEGSKTNHKVVEGSIGNKFYDLILISLMPKQIRNRIRCHIVDNTPCWELRNGWSPQIHRMSSNRKLSTQTPCHTNPKLRLDASFENIIIISHRLPALSIIVGRCRNLEMFGGDFVLKYSPA